MKILEKVLWAVDFDEDHENSIEKILRIAQQFGNEIILLHVLPNDVKNSSFQNLVERSVSGELEKLKAELGGSGEYEVSTNFVYGNVVDSILDVSEEENVNIILVNPCSPYTKKPGKLGLNAQKIIRNSRIPVGIISDDPPRDTKQIVCPVDCSEPSSVALNAAILSAKKSESKLSVISVYEPIEVTSPRFIKAGVDEKAENDRRFESFTREFEDFISGFDFLGVEFGSALLRGTPHEEIVKFSQNASLLFIGSTGKSGLRRAIMGSVTEKVTREVPSNIIVTKYQEVFKLRIPTDIEDIDKHYKRGNELAELGYYQQAMAQYKLCLQVNEMHLPSIKSLADLHERLKDDKQAEYYRELVKIIMEKLMDRKIEEEVRKHYRLGN